MNIEYLLKTNIVKEFFWIKHDYYYYKKAIDIISLILLNKKIKFDLSANKIIDLYNKTKKDKKTYEDLKGKLNWLNKQPPKDIPFYEERYGKREDLINRIQKLEENPLIQLNEKELLNFLLKYRSIVNKTHKIYEKYKIENIEKKITSLSSQSQFYKSQINYLTKAVNKTITSIKKMYPNYPLIKKPIDDYRRSAQTMRYIKSIKDWQNKIKEYQKKLTLVKKELANPLETKQKYMAKNTKQVEILPPVARAYIIKIKKSLVPVSEENLRPSQPIATNIKPVITSGLRKPSLPPKAVEPTSAKKPIQTTKIKPIETLKTKITEKIKMAGFLPENIKKILPIASSLFFMGILLSGIKHEKETKKI